MKLTKLLVSSLCHLLMFYYCIKYMNEMVDPKFYIHGLVLPWHATILYSAQSVYELHMVGAH